MISEDMKRFVEGVGHAFVATADASGHPHIAAGKGVAVLTPGKLLFESWFCQGTLNNLKENPNVAVAVADPVTGNGFQFIGRVDRQEDTAVLDGFLPGLEPAGMPQVQWRLEIRVDSVMAFSAEAHSDRPLG